MTSDFENDEIKDTAFPVDFSDDGESLDIYGVWVKSGPRDVQKTSVTPVTTVTPVTPVTPVISDILPDFIDDQVPEPESSSIPEENFDLNDLPDIDDITSLSLETDTGTTEKPDFSDINFENIELTKVIESNEQPSGILEELSDEIDESAFNTVDASDFLDEITFDDSAVEKTVDQAEPIHDIPTEPVDMSDFAFNAINPEELGKMSSGGSIDEVPENDLLDLPDEPREDIPEEEISLDSFVSEEITAVSEDDFSGFLDDLNAGTVAETPRSAPSDDLDLDSFIDSFNETGGTAGNENEQIYDDIDPVDLELEFDESFIEDSEKIKATGASVTESEFFNSEFGVELIDETSLRQLDVASDDSSNFDEMFNETQISEVSVKEPEVESLYEQTDEFDDLLSSLDTAHIPVANEIESKQTTQKTKVFELTVTEEDSLDSTTAEIAESTDSQDFDVSFFGNAVKEEKLDLPEIRDYNTTESDVKSESVLDVIEEPMFSEAMTPDFDDIRALEQELNEPAPDTGDETVVANDKSTELLMIIADELSSIKKEITTLKSELSSFKAVGLVAEPAVEPANEEAGDNSGFFSDDDTDETIALTGDELNNILITADFTEEKGESLDGLEDSIPESLDEITASALSGSDIDLKNEEDAVEIPETLPDSIFDMPTITDVTSIEVAHVNKIDDDVSYLEGSDSVEPELTNVAIDESEIETIDFNDEKLEEPVLTEFNIDLSEIEESFNNIENSSVVQPAEETIDANETIEIPLSMMDEPLEIPEEPVFETTENLVDLDVPSENPVEEEPSVLPVQAPASTIAPMGANAPVGAMASLPVDLKNEIKSVLSYMDQLLESLPEEKIEEFAKSEHFEVYKKLFEELGIS
jgi:hypothetical protein